MAGRAEIASMTVNETIARWPEAVAVFNRFGIDSCCGGAVDLVAAAERDGADAGELLRELEALLQRAP